MDARWLLQSQASHLHEVPEQGEDVVFKNEKASLNLADRHCRPVLKQLLAKGLIYPVGLVQTNQEPPPPCLGLGRDLLRLKHGPARLQCVLSVIRRKDSCGTGRSCLPHNVIGATVPDVSSQLFGIYLFSFVLLLIKLKIPFQVKNLTSMFQRDCFLLLCRF